MTAKGNDLYVIGENNTSSTTLHVKSFNNRANLRLRYNSATTIPANTVLGSLVFQSDDTAGVFSKSGLIGRNDSVQMFVLNSTNNFVYANTITILNNGFIGVGLQTPLHKLHVGGDIYSNSSILAQGYMKLGSYTTTERNGLTASNGMLIYNTTVNKIQAYQNGAWINLDTGAAA
jgi:hypothetical protein